MYMISKSNKNKKRAEEKWVFKSTTQKKEKELRKIYMAKSEQERQEWVGEWLRGVSQTERWVNVGISRAVERQNERRQSRAKATNVVHVNGSRNLAPTDRNPSICHGAS